MIVEIYTDGAAKGNPGNGGYGAILRFGNKEKELSQGFRRTTNNRMELLAVIVALENLKSNTYPVVVYSDSKYVVDVGGAQLADFDLGGFTLYELVYDCAAAFSARSKAKKQNSSLIIS